MAADGGQGVRIGPLTPIRTKAQERRYWEKLRVMAPAERMAEVFRLSQLEIDRIEQRIRALRPTATDREVKLRRFAIIHGRELSVGAFGWDPLVRGW